MSGSLSDLQLVSLSFQRSAGQALGGLRLQRRGRGRHGRLQRGVGGGGGGGGGGEWEVGGGGRWWRVGGGGGGGGGGEWEVLTGREGGMNMVYEGEVWEGVFI